MATWAIVPVKPLKRAKGRLSEVFTADEREDLGRNLLIHTLEILGQLTELERTLVISRDSSALQVARAHAAYTITEKRKQRLNGALARATDMAHAFNAQAVLVLATDLPLVSVEDVRALLRAAPGGDPAVVKAPDRNRKSTNALLVRPPGLLKYQFGRDSVTAHLAQARRMGADVSLLERRGLQLDLDRPEDIAKLRPELSGRILPN